MRFSLVVLLPISLILVLGGLVSAQAPQAAAPGFGSSVSIERSGNEAYLLKAKISDLASGQVLAGPAVKIPAGQNASTETTLPDRDEVVSLSANVDAASQTATYSLVVKKGKAVVSEHTARIAL